MSTKSHWRQAGLLSGLAAVITGFDFPAPMPSTGQRSKKRTPGRFLDRVTNAMLSGAKWPGDPARRSFVRPWRSTDGMTGKAYRRQQKRQRRTARELARTNRFVVTA